MISNVLYVIIDICSKTKCPSIFPQIARPKTSDFLHPECRKLFQQTRGAKK